MDTLLADLTNFVSPPAGARSAQTNDPAACKRPSERKRTRGKDKTPRKRRARLTLDTRDPWRSFQRAHASRTKRATIIRWTIAHQARAVGEGWFLERDMQTNHVILRALPLASGGRAARANGHQPREAWSASEAWAHLERMTFRNSVFHALAIAFIEQQARHQFSDAWDRTVQRYSPRLRWYKTFRTEQRIQSRAYRALRREP